MSSNPIFANLEKPEIGEIIRKVKHQARTFTKGDLIASEGDEVNYLTIIVKGSVVTEMIDFDGKVLQVETLKAPDAIATAFLFGDKNRFPVNVTATEETKLLYIARADLLSLFCEDTRVLQNFLNNMANRAQFLSKQMKILGLSNIRGKIAHYLLEQYKLQNKLSFTIPLTQNQLAERFGVTRPALARSLREMNEEGIIKSKGKSYTITDVQRLKTLIR